MATGADDDSDSDSLKDRLLPKSVNLFLKPSIKVPPGGTADTNSDVEYVVNLSEDNLSKEDLLELVRVTGKDKAHFFISYGTNGTCLPPGGSRE